MAVGKKGEQTKRKIFAIAMRLFKEKGYDNVTVDEIVKEAEIAKGTFYIYFPTKAHIVGKIFPRHPFSSDVCIFYVRSVHYTCISMCVIQ